MAIDPEHMYSNETERYNSDIYNDFKLKKKIWPLWFIQKYFSIAKVNKKKISKL